jgi:hypothetical protein
MPFGLWGALAFGWFCIAAIRLLWMNYRYGDPAIKNVNTFLLVAFLGKLAFFTFIFGAFYLDLSYFTGIAALSISMNRGIAKAPALAPFQVKKLEPEPAAQTDPEVPAWQPAFARRLQPW